MSKNRQLGCEFLPSRENISIGSSSPNLIVPLSRLSLHTYKHTHTRTHTHTHITDKYSQFKQLDIFSLGFQTRNADEMVFEYIRTETIGVIRSGLETAQQLDGAIAPRNDPRVTFL